MTKDTATQVCDQLEAADFGYTRTVDTAGNHTIALSVTSLNGPQILGLVGILAPNGAAIPGITATIVGGFTLA